MKELDKKFDFKTVDEKWTNYWVDQNIFHAKANPDKNPYTIVIPPPNVTGILHMGHALNNTLQDIIIRYKRMSGHEALWMPGTDHAGIATQNVVEKQLAKEGKNRHDIGRDEMTKRLWEWKQQYGDTIIHQLKKLGASCDWERTSFTMDDNYSDAVLEVFIHLYEKGLIYRGQRIINWCPRCHTALSDEEAEHQESQGNLWHIRYALKDDPTKYLVVATTRPETMLGDTAVAVNPNDERYKDFIGKTLILPIMNREIPVVSDEFVDPEFGTGAVKVTPAHDPNDFEMGQRHNLEFINVMNEDASMNDLAGDYAGMDRFEAREAIVSKLSHLKLLDKIEPHQHAVGHCYRCDIVVEPYLSKQWFVKMKPLAEPALKAVVDGRITFHPDRWSKVYTNWMENIRDWCISRQIWWGHRIPVWYDEEGNAFVAKNEEEAQAKAGAGVALKQDEDVLDTWFSSWLWPFATLNWPQDKENADLKYFYPTSSLFTASEIIFFWVARMVMAGFEFMGDIPFSEVYIHGTVRDTQGRKMSKSLGNAIDPLEIIEEYGADALRFSLIINSGQDLYISKEKFEIGRNFANKIWNASRLILMNCQNIDKDFNLEEVKELDLPSQWIISRFYTTLEKVGQAIEKYRYSEAESLIYEFFWNNFCDWYLEIIKDRWADTNIQNIAYKILEQSLKMMHPFIPFVTEELWSVMNEQDGSISTQSWPQISQQLINESAEKNMTTVIEVISALRNLRAQWNIKPNDSINCHCASKDSADQQLLTQAQDMIKKLARIDQLTIEEQLSQTKNIATAVVTNIKCAVPLGDIIDVEKEKVRILKQIDEQKKAYTGLAKRLQNQNFLEKAPADVIEKEKERLQSLESKNRELQEVIANLQ